MTNQQVLTLEIETKRTELYREAERLSFTSPTVLRLSHELDQLLLEYALAYESRVSRYPRISPS